MPHHHTRREFLTQVGAAAAAVTLPGLTACTRAQQPRPAPAPDPRVAIARDEALLKGQVADHAELLRKLLDGSLQKVTGAADATTAWRSLFAPTSRIGIKVNTLGRSTQPAVVDAIVAGLRRADVPERNIIIWDRFDVELAHAGYKLNRSTTGPRCFGTDAEHIGSGYLRQVESNGQIGSCFSKIVAEQVDTLICVPVLKDHNLAGISAGLKNFFGAIHNPNKYHENNCDPFVADVAAHHYIAPKWRLTVCDGTRAQYHAGPGRHSGFAWDFGGLIVGTDVVATDAVAADLLDQQRLALGLKTLAAEDRPARHIATAAQHNLGIADLNRIERLTV